VLRESLTKVVIILELFLADFIEDIVTGVWIKHKSCEFSVSWLLAMVERPWLKGERNTTGKFSWCGGGLDGYMINFPNFQKNQRYPAICGLGPAC
jgi:hypothetical protein